MFSDILNVSEVPEKSNGPSSNLTRRSALFAIIGGGLAAATGGDMPQSAADDTVLFAHEILKRVSQVEPSADEDTRLFLQEFEWRMEQLAARLISETDPAKLGPTGRAALDRLRSIVEADGGANG